DALAAHGIPFDPGLAPSPPDRPGPRHPAVAVAAVVDAGVPVDALVAASMPIAAAAIAALADRGLRVPEDVAVAGFDGADPEGTDADPGDVDELLPEGARPEVTPQLTTARAPVEAIASRALQLLMAVLRDEPSPGVDTLASELVVGASCGCARGADPPAADAPA